MALTIGVCSEAGRRSPPNEDAVLVHGPDDGVTLALLADGMGGHKSGERASHEAVTTIDEVMFAGSSPTVDGAISRLHAAVSAANVRIRQLAQADPALTDMGCTVVLALVIGDVYWIGHVGDSRAYLVTPVGIQQLTDDHTWVNARVKEGLLTPEQAAKHPRRHVLDQALGASDTVDLTVQRAARVRPGIRLILCSDGVHDVLTPEAMRRVAASDEAQAAAEKLVQHAIQASSEDNASAIVLCWEAALMTDPMEFVDTKPEFKR